MELFQLVASVTPWKALLQLDVIRDAQDALHAAWAEAWAWEADWAWAVVWAAAVRLAAIPLVAAGAAACSEASEALEAVAGSAAAEAAWLVVEAVAACCLDGLCNS